MSSSVSFSQGKPQFKISETIEEITEDRAMQYDTTRAPGTVRLLTFNTWGLKFVSKHRKERLQALADRLASDSPEDDYDIVALQEVWTEEDWSYIDRVCANKFKYRRCFSSGILTGPGLAVLSKIPIKKTYLNTFPINGRPSAFFRGDWYVGKSVAVTILEPTFANASPIAILNSHMHAPYSLTGDAAYSCHRACQAWEIATLTGNLSESGYAVILVGDLNSRPGSLPYRIIQHEGQLEDSWEVLNGVTDLEHIKTMEPVQQIRKAATTCDSTLNTWRADRRPDEACRLDYALIDSKRLVPVAASVEFTEKIQGIGSYSDHFAYSATFKVLPKSSSESYAESEYELETFERLAAYHELRDVIHEYITDTHSWQCKWRLWHFFISIIVFILFLPGIVFASIAVPWVSIIFLLLGVIIMVTGVVNGMIGFLFGRNEFRALREVVFQVDDRLKYLKENQTD